VLELVGTGLERDLNSARKGGSGWRHELTLLIANNVAKRTGSKPGVTSFKTQQERRACLLMIFETLHKLGFAIEKPENLGGRHVEALVNHWNGAGLIVGSPRLATSTVDNYLSHLRIFAKWVGKPALVQSLPAYCAGDAERQGRDYGAKRDKTITPAQLNEWLGRARKADPSGRLGAMLLLEAFLGLRSKEAYMFRPHSAIVRRMKRQWIANMTDTREDSYEYADSTANTDAVELSKRSGTKGGRPRYIELWHPVQRQVVEHAAGLCKAGCALGWYDDLEYQLRYRQENPSDLRPQWLKMTANRYRSLMHRHVMNLEVDGFTGHDLRASFAIHRLEEMGYTPAIKAGIITQQSSRTKSKLAKQAREQVMQDLGHSRASIGGAYYGKEATSATAPAVERPPSAKGRLNQLELFDGALVNPAVPNSDDIGQTEDSWLVLLGQTP
jgi:integrase